MLCMKKINKIPLLTLRYFVLLLIPVFFFKIYPYLAMKYPLLGEHTSPREWQRPGVRVFDGVIFPLLLGARINEKFLQSSITYNFKNTTFSCVNPVVATW